MVAGMNSSPPVFLVASGITKSFDKTAVLRGIDLRIEEGETVCLLGPSGCGKTTLLRILAGLEQADQGQVVVEGQDISHMPAHLRDFGLMFQDYVLFPHLNVADNIAFGLRMHGWPAERIAGRVAELLDLVGLEDYGKRKVFDLSGGQQQRVALARSLAPMPRLLMLDEPLGSLDRVLRDQLLTELRLLLERLHQTAIYVTHDQLEAFAVADRVALMNEGRIEQEAPPGDLYLRPATPFVARFLGFKNLLAGRVVGSDSGLRISTGLGELHLPEAPPGLQEGEVVDLIIRPEGARLSEEAWTGPNRWRMRLDFHSFRGSHTVLRFVGEGAGQPSLEFEMPGYISGLRNGQKTVLDLVPTAVVLMAMR